MQWTVIVATASYLLLAMIDPFEWGSTITNWMTIVFFAVLLGYLAWAFLIDGYDTIEIEKPAAEDWVHDSMKEGSGTFMWELLKRITIPTAVVMVFASVFRSVVD